MEFWNAPINKDDQLRQIIDDTNEIISNFREKSEIIPDKVMNNFKEKSEIIPDRITNRFRTMYNLGTIILDHKKEIIDPYGFLGEKNINSQEDEQDESLNVGNDQINGIF